MALMNIDPTRIDRAIASTIADRTNGGIEQTARALTWGADEHVVLMLAAAGWIYVRFRRPDQKPIANHVLLVSIATAALPHVFKSVVKQTRPDRLTARGHLHGAPLSRHARDAFPSGHAVHMGALASAAGLLSPAPRRLVRLAAVGLSLTRIAALAHWASDVLASFGLGILVERMLRPLSLGYRRNPTNEVCMPFASLPAG